MTRTPNSCLVHVHLVLRSSKSSFYKSFFTTNQAKKKAHLFISVCKSKQVQKYTILPDRDLSFPFESETNRALATYSVLRKTTESAMTNNVRKI